MDPDKQIGIKLKQLYDALNVVQDYDAVKMGGGDYYSGSCSLEA
jgi:hypothetical protein